MVDTISHRKTLFSQQAEAKYPEGLNQKIGLFGVSVGGFTLSGGDGGGSGAQLSIY